MQLEFTIHAGTTRPDLAAVEGALLEFDPSALIDTDAASGNLRIWANASELELSLLLAKAGYPVPVSRIERMPSVCCGGCSG
ncbi:hypothetical protein [Xanthomonas sp. XNM01]|jgi:hypothetical protein|uniref:hypothetical protein n=1 Tax=Xanthomonas sp. XNM01 TaxID=2769289 RepID=UPI00177F6715|nr:hypothetical protein [Xanthomonas sp. XNM01]MBD9367111.1 hypothetical protein [Xanthomonas sp. XNM01]